MFKRVSCDSLVSFRLKWKVLKRGDNVGYKWEPRSKELWTGHQLTNLLSIITIKSSYKKHYFIKDLTLPWVELCFLCYMAHEYVCLKIVLSGWASVLFSLNSGTFIIVFYSIYFKGRITAIFWIWQLTLPHKYCILILSKGLCFQYDLNKKNN